jgi:DNA topoisomerase-1
LQDRDYAHLEDKHFIPTDLGNVVSDQLTGHFSEVMNVGFTAQMEDALDQVADGRQNWVELLDKFSAEFNPTLQKATMSMDSVKGGLEAGLNCLACGKPMLIKFGKAGPFLACGGYPDCRNTANFTRDEQGNVQVEERQPEKAQIMGTCSLCGKDLVLKKARTGSRFIACSGYPDCKHAAPFPTGVSCPKCKEGNIVEKSSKKGKIFYACDRYPNCDYAIWDYPVSEPCPNCGSPILTHKTTRTGTLLACPSRSCKYKKSTM